MRVPEVDGTIDRPRICGCDVVSAIEEPAFPVPAVPAWLGGETPVRCTSVKLRKVAPGRPHGLDHRCAAIRPVGVKVQEYAVGHRAETSNEGSQLESRRSSSALSDVRSETVEHVGRRCVRRC